MSTVKLTIVLGEIQDFFFTVEVNLLRVIHLDLFKGETLFFTTDTIDIALFQLDERYAVFYLLFFLMNDLVLNIKLVL